MGETAQQCAGAGCVCHPDNIPTNPPEPDGTADHAADPEVGFSQPGDCCDSLLMLYPLG